MIDQAIATLKAWPKGQRRDHAIALAEQLEAYKAMALDEPAIKRYLMVAELEIARGRDPADTCADCAFIGALLGLEVALDGLLCASDIARMYRVTERRARAIIENRHRRFGIGIKVGNMWVVHKHDLWLIEPERD